MGAMGFTAMSRGFFAQRRKQSLLRARRFCHRTRLATEMLEDRLAPAGTGPTLQLVPASGPTITLALDTFQFGAQHPVILGLTNGQVSAESGRTQFDSLDVTADRSSNSPALFGALAGGAPYKTATLTETNAAGQRVAAWVMSTVYVTGDTTTGTGDTNPTSPAAEELELTFGAVSVANSAAAASWSQVSNAPQAPSPPTGLAPTPVFIPSPETNFPTLELDPAGGAPPIYLDLTGFQFGAQNNIAPSAANFKPGKMQFDSLDVTTVLNSNSPALFAALAGGGQFTTATLREPGPAGTYAQPVAVWVMSAVYLTSDTTTGTGDPTIRPVEKLNFTFAAASEAIGQPPRIASWNQLTNLARGPQPPGLTFSPVPTPAATALTLQLVPASGPTITLNLDTFQFGARNSTAIDSFGIHPGKTQFDALDVTTALNGSSPALFQALAGGGQFRTVTLTENAQGGSPPTLKPFATWVMSTVYVTGDTSSWTDANGRQLPVEELKLTFAEATTANGIGGASSTAGTGPTLQLVPASGPTITLALGTFQSSVQNSVTIGTTTAGGGPGSTPFDSLDRTTGRISNSPALFGALTGGDMKTATRVLGRRPWRAPSAASHRAKFTGDSRPVPAQPLPNLSRRAIAARHTGSSGG
jgi:type VI protein secretion system component Hcp